MIIYNTMPQVIFKMWNATECSACYNVTMQATAVIC